MKYVIDASVALKWFLSEDDRAQARRLLEGDFILIAPDLVVPEVMNGLWKATRRGLIGPPQAMAVPAVLLRAFSEIFVTQPLAERGLEISLELDHPAYDVFYIALAERERAVMLTSDERFWRKTRRTKYAKTVRRLGDYVPS